MNGELLFCVVQIKRDTIVSESWPRNALAYNNYITFTDLIISISHLKQGLVSAFTNNLCFPKYCYFSNTNKHTKNVYKAKKIGSY